MSIAVTVPAVQDIMDTEEERSFWEVVRHHERPPFYDVQEGVNNRLNRAARLVYEERITPNSDGSYTVETHDGHTYRVREHCSCPDGTYRKERPCYHAVAVALYVEWHRRLRHTPPPLATQVPGSSPGQALASDPDEDEALGNGDPVDDETLPLPLGPTTVDERYATAVADLRAMTEQITAQQSRGEPPMTEDPSPYIPEPATAPVAVLEPLAPPTVRIPKEYTIAIKGKTHVLYTGLVLAARSQGLLTLSADWTYNDADLSLAHAVCTFADGRRYEDSGDATPTNVSKGITAHFRRVALTRAKARCLRDALGISECSVEELAEDTGKREVPDLSPPARPTSTRQDLRQHLWGLIKAQAPHITTREDAAAWVQEETGYDMVPDNYAAIAATLEQGA